MFQSGTNQEIRNHAGNLGGNLIKRLTIPVWKAKRVKREDLP